MHDLRIYTKSVTVYIHWLTPPTHTGSRKLVFMLGKQPLITFHVQLTVPLIIWNPITWYTRVYKIFSLDMFHFFRRALATYWAEYPDARLFAVMVDTSSKIENFAPTSRSDKSALQEMLEGGGQLLHPYILRGTFDAYFEQFKLPNGTQDLTLLLSTNNHLFAGRPLIAIPFPDSEQQLGFISRKLFGGATPDWTKPSLGHLSVVLRLTQQTLHINQLPISICNRISGRAYGSPFGIRFGTCADVCFLSSRTKTCIGGCHALVE